MDDLPRLTESKIQVQCMRPSSTLDYEAAVRHMNPYPLGGAVLGRVLSISVPSTGSSRPVRSSVIIGNLAREPLDSRPLGHKKLDTVSKRKLGNMFHLIVL